MKKILYFMFILISLVLLFSNVYAEGTMPVKVMVNNQYLKSDVPSVNDNGLIMSPIKELVNAFGGEYSFDNSSLSYLTTKILYNETEIVLKLDSSIAQVNGKYIQMPGRMKIINNRIMIPAKFIAQMLGGEVFIHAKTGELMIFQPTNNNIVYVVQSGDSLWRISQIFGTSINNLKVQNNLTSDMLYIGQKLVVKQYSPSLPKITGIITTNGSLRSSPSSTSNSNLIAYLQVGLPFEVMGKNGSWYKVKCSKGTGYVSIWVSTINQDITYTNTPSTYFTSKIPTDTSGDYVTYFTYTVVQGDTIWKIAEKNGIPDYELLKVNNLTSSSIIYIGQKLNIPVHNIASKPNINGVEILDWFSQANYVFPIGKIGKVTDIKTGKSFMVQRTMGANHSDTETLTATDTAIMREIFGGSWTWNRRAFILEVDRRKFAVSIAGMPHAGVDGVPFYQNVSNRSDGYGYGPNLDRISGNGMSGHFDLYFFNGLRHKDNQIDPQHQLTVSIAGGLK